jgi:NADH-quinone oxidoreductase subunit L
MNAAVPIHLIVLLPLMGAAFNGLFGQHLKRSVVAGVACAAACVSFLISVEACLRLAALPASARTIEQPPLFEWIGSGGLSVPWAFALDPLAAVFCLVVTGIAFLVHLDAAASTDAEAGSVRSFTGFGGLLSATLLLVLAENMLLMFFGWAAVGVATAALVGFGSDDETRSRGALRAFVVGRIGDLGILVAIVVVLYALWRQGLGMTLGFGALTDRSPQLGGQATTIGLLLLVAAAARSAQVPLHVWLPRVVAGPAPSTALICAATALLSGVYVVARMHFVFIQSPVAMTAVATLGGVSALWAAVLALVQHDIQRGLAWGAASQLGFAFLGVGVGAFDDGLFHALVHAVSMACLFLGAGSVSRGLSGERDIRAMGGLRQRMPLTAWTFACGASAVAGAPLLSGFFARDAVLWATFRNQHTLVPGPLLWLLGVVAGVITAFYMVRLYALTFEGGCRADGDAARQPPPTTWLTRVPLVLLASGAVVGGVFGMPRWIRGTPEPFRDGLQPVFAVSNGLSTFGEPNVPLALGLMAVTVGLAALAGFVAYRLHWKGLPAREPFPRATRALRAGRFSLDGVYTTALVRPLERVSAWLWRRVDDGLVDGILVNGWAALAGLLGGLSRLFTTGDAQRYAVVAFIGLWALAVMAGATIWGP